MAKPTQAPAPDPSQLTREELQYLKAKAEQVIYLLEASAMPPEAKTAWVNLMPHMTLDQVDTLIGLLEKELALTLEYAEKHPEDEELLLKMQALKERYDEKLAAADKRAMGQLKKITDDIVETIGADKLQGAQTGALAQLAAIAGKFQATA